MVLPLAKTINTAANHNLRNGSAKNGNESLYNLKGDGSKSNQSQITNHDLLNPLK